MSPEQDPTDKSDAYDPSINPKVLVEQEGPNKGTIATPEMVLNAGKEDERPISLEELKDHKYDNYDESRTVGGLPLIGAYAENKHRDDVKASNASNDYNFSDKDMRMFEERSKHPHPHDHLAGKVPKGTTPKQMAEMLHDDIGTEAMATEVKKRAMALVPEEATDELREEYGELAANKFKDELIAKQAERKSAEETKRKADEEAASAEKQAAQEVANAKTREMISKLKKVDTPLSELIEVPDETDAAKAFRDMPKTPDTDSSGIVPETAGDSTPRSALHENDEPILPANGEMPTYP
jgi:hypothetical protein